VAKKKGGKKKGDWRSRVDPLDFPFGANARPRKKAGGRRRKPAGDGSL
jgi:hypothetical protein